jgi:hypothetical protein
LISIVSLKLPQRNPDIKLYGLPWTFPGWVGGGVLNPFINRTATVEYTMNWIKGALLNHGLKINYIGVGRINILHCLEIHYLDFCMNT